MLKYLTFTQEAGSTPGDALLKQKAFRGKTWLAPKRYRMLLCFCESFNNRIL